jgi:hypothetical protein
MSILHDAALAAKVPDSDLQSVKDWLVGQLTAQEHSKLEQGGHTKHQIPLRRVFIDLPVSRNLSEAIADRSLFLENLLQSPSIPLDRVRKESPSDVEESKESIGSIMPKKYKFSASLLIGGPGQGKSTLGQIASQIHRANLLRPHKHELHLSQRALVESFFDKNAALEPLSPKQLSLPIQITLPELSTWLSKNDLSRDLPLIYYFIGELPSARSVKLNVHSLRTLMMHLPLLVIFDGFDEVGAQEDRKRVVNEIRHFLSDLALIGAEAQVIATTRPQGYTGELSLIGLPLNSHFLTPLSTEEALTYARKLIEAKINGEDERAKMLLRMDEASKDQSTSRLLTSPLQVTILAALVQQIGRAPRERWNLFHRYFRYAYEREIERETYASNLLATFRPQIERIHARLGLLLQIEAEKAGGASARMSRGELLQVIHDVLLEDEFGPSERNRMAEAILQAAGQRLVFIVEPELGSFGFEIRSLQEFMAAWAITSGRDAIVSARIKALGNAAIFRNVLLFVTSRLFSESSYLRDFVIEELCPSSRNVSDRSISYAKSRSILALEILEEGAVQVQPKYARMLTEIAAELLDVPAERQHVRLASVITNETKKVLISAIEEYLKGLMPAQEKFGAWLCLTKLIAQEVPEAKKLGEIYFPSGENAQRIISLARAYGTMSLWLLEKAEQHALYVAGDSFVSSIILKHRDPKSWAEWIACTLESSPRSSQAHYIWADSINDDIVPIKEPEYEPPRAWVAFIDYLRFSYDPNSEKLARFIESVANNLPQHWSRLEWNKLWPTKAAIESANSPSDLQNIAQLARKGVLGDKSLWVNAQKKWIAKWKFAVPLDNIKLPWDAKALGKVPPVLLIPRFALGDALEDIAYLEQAFKLLTQHESGGLRRWLALLCARCVLYLKKEQVPVDKVRFLLEYFPSESSILLFPKLSAMRTDEWIERVCNYFTVCGFNGQIGPETVVAGRKNRRKIDSRLLKAAALCITKDVIDYSFGDDRDFSEFAQTIGNFKPEDEDDQLSLAILKLYSGTLNETSDDWLVGQINDLPDAMLRSCVHAIYARRLSAERQIKLLTAIYPKTSSDQKLKHDVIILLNGAIASMKSGLSHSDTLADLQLLPRQTAAGSESEMTSGEPVVVNKIELDGVGRFRKFEGCFAPPKAGAGQWCVIIGRNGAGKTTLLRAITVALRNVNDSSLWPGRIWQRQWLTKLESPTDFIKEGRIRIELNKLEPLNTYIIAGSQLHFSQMPIHNTARQVPIFAYGCRRGGALGGNNREVDLSEAAEVATLLDDSASLIHAETWIKDLDGEANRNPRASALYSTVRRALCELIEVEDIFVESRRVWVRETNRPTILFSELSDGYLASAGWFVDLVARWLELAEKNSWNIHEDFMMEMTGLVLIDEIDLHLHPKWQVEIIQRTKRLLPKMSFIVTTHNALTLVGANSDEIWVLEDSEAGEPQARTVREPAVLMSGGELFQKYFGIEDIYPAEVGRAVQDFFFLTGLKNLTSAQQQELQVAKEKMLNSGIVGLKKAVDAIVEN